MENKRIFEILIYSCDQESLNKHIIDSVNAYSRSWGFTISDKIKSDIVSSEIKRLSYPVRYNEIIGAIEIYADNRTLHADYYFTRKQRIMIISRSKIFINYKGKLCKLSFKSHLTSQEIFENFKKCLLAYIAEKKRLIDFDAFDHCGKYTDRRELLGLNTI